MNVETILATFGGGVFGALLGGTAAFIFVGLTGLVGIGIILAGGSTDFLFNISFGPFLGPHVAFAGAVSAAAFAGRKKHLASGADVNTPLGFTQDPAVLLVGGVVGIIGLCVNYFYVETFHQYLPLDSVAFQ